jgi:SprT-like family
MHMYALSGIDTISLVGICRYTGIWRSRTGSRSTKANGEKPAKTNIGFFVVKGEITTFLGFLKRKEPQTTNKMLSSQSDTSKSLRAKRIHERFDRDFLPKYGGLWRSMIASNDSQTAVAKKPDFLDAILTRRSTHINVQSGMEKCNCGECQPPILDWEQECREPNDDNSEPEVYSSTGSMDQQDLGEESLFEEGRTPATPLASDLDDAFGRLTCDDSPNTDQHDRRLEGDGVVSGVSDQLYNDSCYSRASGNHVDGIPNFPGSSRANEPKIGVYDSLVIDLMDTDEEEDDEDFPARNSGKARQSSSSLILVDSSEDETCVPTPKYPARQRVPTKTLHIESDSDDDNCEALSDFHDESSSDSDLHAPSRRSFSKLAKTPSRLDLDTENWNPNRMKLKETMAPATFKKKREAMSKAYFDEYNKAVFEGQLATQVNIVWSNKLRTTAGLTRLKRRQVDFTPGAGMERSATIELSTKVLDDPERLASTLLHEMVHAAAWILGKSVFGSSFTVDRITDTN